MHQNNTSLQPTVSSVLWFSYTRIGHIFRPIASVPLLLITIIFYNKCESILNQATFFKKDNASYSDVPWNNDSSGRFELFPRNFTNLPSFSSIGIDDIIKWLNKYYVATYIVWNQGCMYSEPSIPQSSDRESSVIEVVCLPRYILFSSCYITIPWFCYLSKILSLSQSSLWFSNETYWSGEW